MRKNKTLFKQTASFLTAFMMFAQSSVYAQEVQTSQEETTPASIEQVQQEEVAILSETEESSIVSEEPLETLAEQSEVQTEESLPESDTESEQESSLLVPETSEQEFEESSLQEEEQESFEENSSEENSSDEEESDSEEETSAWPTDEFEEDSSSSEDSEVYEIGDEFVKTFSLDMTVDTNPIYLGMAGVSTATGSYYDQLDATSKRIYNLIYEANKSSASTTKIKLNLTKIFENQTVTKNSNGKVVYSDSTKQAIFAWLGSYVTPAYLALTYDHPELVWLSGAKYNIGYSVYTPIFYDGETSIVTDLELAGSTFTLMPTTDNGVLTSSKVTPLFNGTKSQIDSSLPASATRYDTVKAIHDKICSMVQYEDATQNIGNAYYQTPYSLYYDADGDGKIETVCAGYAKMMKIQCEKYGIPCVLVTGVTNTGEYHMWNYIQMEDGVWYAVDATWDDQSTIMYDFFLVGSETYSSAAFGTKKFGDTHIPSGKWTTSADCVFKYPVFSKTAYKAQNVAEKSGLVKDSDGVWRYYKNNQVDTSYTSLVYNGGTWYYIQNGSYNTSYSGLASCNGSWYYVKNGTIDWTYTSLSLYNGVWYYLKNGVVNWDYTGLYQYKNIWFYIKNGAIDWSYTGLCQSSGTWYSIKNGQVDWSAASYATSSVNAMLNADQFEESSVDVTNQYASGVQESSTESEESLEKTTEAQEESVQSTVETQADSSVQAQTSNDRSTQTSLLETIEQYLIQLIMNLVKAILTCIGL